MPTKLQQVQATIEDRILKDFVRQVLPEVVGSPPLHGDAHSREALLSLIFALLRIQKLQVFLRIV